jgi:Ser/Thr protein kinase RdoA (MazF antagonist)
MDEALELARIADHCLPGTGAPRLEQLRHRGTTEVYRITRAGRTLYARVAEEAGEEMTVEAAVHVELRRRGARVPEVVALEPAANSIGRGVLVVTDMPGRPLTEAGDLAPGALQAVAIEAGYDLALINSVPVAGFGFVSRDRYPPLSATLETAEKLLLTPATEALELLRRSELDAPEADQIVSILAEGSSFLSNTPSQLAHGDFDPTHIYVDGGSYAGLIDFGEMRGAPPLYDAAFYALHEHQLKTETLPSLLEGYGETSRVSARQIASMAIMIGVQLLEVMLKRDARAYSAVLHKGICHAIKAAHEDR